MYMASDTAGLKCPPEMAPPKKTIAASATPIATGPILFDANCMEEYHIMQRFEARAWPKFDPDVEEYTFEQQDLHKEFCALFEGLTEGFITAEGWTIDDFYSAVARAAEKRGASGRDAAGGETAPRPWGETDAGEDAEEVVEVVFQVADFQLWAAEMRGIARNNLQWQARRDADEAVFQQVGGGGGGGARGAVQFSPSAEVSTLAARMSLAAEQTSPQLHQRVMGD